MSLILSAPFTEGTDFGCGVRTQRKLPNPYTQRKLELESLHALLGRWRNDLSERRWAGLYVVICAHQPRYREAACQYFGRLLHQPEGSGAEREDRLVYAEGLCDVDSALDLLARHIVDQWASNLLFGDRRRLQEDLLADAASLFPKVRGCPSGAQRRAK
jgi:hypothetical protein